MDVVESAARTWHALLPELDTEPMLVVGRVQRLWSLWDARLRPLFADAGLHAGDFEVLASLRRARGATAPGALARAMLVTAGATTKRIDRLLALGLVERVADPADGRHRRVRLTDRGVELADRLMQAHLANQAALLAELEPHERRELGGLLARLLARAETPPRHPHPPNTREKKESTVPTPNLFIVYVTDVAASTEFYGAIFEMTPRFTSPRFVDFELAEGVGLALWSGGGDVDASTPRTSEVCLNLPGGPDAIEQQYARWKGLGVEIVREPHDDVFGRTFVAKDPDGNLLRVAPVDPA